MKTNFYSTSEEEFTKFVTEAGQPKFRVAQVRDWVFDKGVTDFEEMQNLPAKLRQLLSDHYSLGSLSIAVEQVSKDGTRKRAYMLHDGKMIESVLMPYEDGRRTACISSQVGCSMG
jgi:23S rRNA (adenine2503-C2)-methyltransferase